ncbi:CobW family GTP-binding protein [Agrobacterium rosae]|uniref:Putative GTP-binding protein YjiA n=1 Tax=Agrobacterium rosae TaxID=1972867 RepID=A0A1R3U917_9HYPH|nr:GTP-binding protein [Agrobacterium rosae]SCX35601.1 putative GTP-binding protein YjiA [Agrobacterium rosae]
MLKGVDPVAVTVLTGYLGAGETTLLNRLLTEPHGRKYAVIVNKFGEVGIDNDLIVDSDEDVFEMNNGCICCTVSGDLIQIIEGLTRRRDRFDGILIETTGLADPAPVVQTFFVDEDVRSKTRLDSITTVVHTKYLLGEIEQAHEAQEQLAFADTIILNKIDLLNKAELAAVEVRIRRINPVASIVTAERYNVDVACLLDRRGFGIDRVLEVEPDFLVQEHDHDHDDHITSFSRTAREPMDPQRFLEWMKSTVGTFRLALLRMKGTISFADDNERFVVQAVHMILEGDNQRSWKDGEERITRLVFIGRNLPKDIITKGFLSCRVASAVGRNKKLSSNETI